MILVQSSNTVPYSWGGLNKELCFKIVCLCDSEWFITASQSGGSGVVTAIGWKAAGEGCIKKTNGK